MTEDRRDRARMVRERLGLDQRGMADRLNAEAARWRLRAPRYDNTIVSKLENGRRDLSLDDAVLYAALDPERRGIGWLATGVARTALEERAAADPQSLTRFPITVRGVPSESVKPQAKGRGKKGGAA